MSIIENIRGYSSRLKKAAVWKTSKKAVGFVEGSAQKSYEYEFYCYLRILHQLALNYELRYVKGGGIDPHKFPQGAALKENMPRFEAWKNGVKQFQICAGTLVRCDFDSEKNHPDISFQNADASDDPEAADLIMIMDAKFRKNADDRITKGEFYTFKTMLDLFGLPNGARRSILPGNLTELEGNALLTNGLAHKDDDEMNRHYNIKEVEGFAPGENFVVKGK